LKNKKCYMGEKLINKIEINKLLQI